MKRKEKTRDWRNQNRKDLKKKTSSRDKRKKTGTTAQGITNQDQKRQRSNSKERNRQVEYKETVPEMKNKVKEVVWD